jgi:xanthine dehydrogenase YagR molybdenum-binding subunit
MSGATRRDFLRVSITGAGAAAVATTGPAGCAHGPGLRGQVSRARPAEASATVRVDTTVNGGAVTLQVDADDVALDAVRDHLGLTGSKLACGHGACGACTMQLDGTPVTTCILPATALHGRRLTTVEGLARGKALHAVQRAFMAHDGLQCGYCTPGFVVEAAAFVDRWRSEQGTRRPDRDAIADALSGHLCRCGAYEQIYGAVAGACEGHFDDAAREKSPRVDARQKVTGKARYTVDVRLPRMLHAKVLHAPVAHASVTRLDWTAALALPGVHGAVDLLGGKKIRYAGQHIVAIAAESERIAERAVALVQVEYDVQPAAVGLDAAAAEGAELVYQGRSERRRPPNASEGPLLPAPWSANVRGPFKVFSKRAGAANREIARAKAAGTVAEGAFSTSVQCHTCLEPHAAVARFEGRKLRVYLSTQAVTSMARDIAERWGMPADDVEVIADYVGGGFGSKATLTTEVIVAVELAKLTRRPVRYAYDRRQELTLGGYRPATQIEVQLAADAAGEMTGLRAITRSDSGVAVGHVCSLMMRLIYPVAPRQLEDWDVTTHAAPAKPFRGPGGPQAFFALEQTVDALAFARGEDPIDVRRRWDPNPGRRRLYEWAEALPVWRDRPAHGSSRGRYRRGVGLAAATWMVFTEPKAKVELRAGRDGIRLRQSSQDMGNGTRTVLADTVAEQLGVPRRDVKIEIGDSRYIHGPMSAGSRTTSSVVPACVDACDQIKAALLRHAVRRHGLRRAHAGAVAVEHATGALPYAELLREIDPVTVVGRRARSEGGFFLPPIMGLATERAVTTSVVVTEVEVDTRLGGVRVLETWGGFNAGRIVSPVLARSQAAGGMIQSVSFALYEERRLDPRRGFLLTGGLEDYRIIGLGDIGRVHVHFDEEGFDRIPGRQVGLSELTTLGVPAAIGNAVFHATGWRPRALPLRPDRVLQGVRS